MFANSRLHRWGHAQCLMDAAEIVVHKPKRNLLAEDATAPMTTGDIAEALLKAGIQTGGKSFSGNVSAVLSGMNHDRKEVVAKADGWGNHGNRQERLDTYKREAASSTTAVHFFQRAIAPLRAIAVLSDDVSLDALALPPVLPPLRPRATALGSFPASTCGSGLPSICSPMACSTTRRAFTKKSRSFGMAPSCHSPMTDRWPCEFQIEPLSVFPIAESRNQFSRMTWAKASSEVWVIESAMFFVPSLAAMAAASP
jgi:hypothetical protein